MQAFPEPLVFLESTMKTLLRIALSLAFLLVSSVYAQYSGPVRPIPANAPKAKMYVESERVLNLNGRAFSLAPGGQILNEKNMITLTSALSDTYTVRVKFDNQLQIQRVWILTTAENEVDAPKLSGDPSFWDWLFSWF